MKARLRIWSSGAALHLVVTLDSLLHIPPLRTTAIYYPDHGSRHQPAMFHFSFLTTHISSISRHACTCPCFPAIFTYSRYILYILAIFNHLCYTSRAPTMLRRPQRCSQIFPAQYSLQLCMAQVSITGPTLDPPNHFRCHPKWFFIIIEFQLLAS